MAFGFLSKVSTVLVSNGSTCKFLSSMETIFGNLVWSFFVSEALYLYKYAKNGFSEEPDIRIYNYILMGKITAEKFAPRLYVLNRKC